MTLDELKKELQAVFGKVTDDNFGEYLQPFADVIIKYRDSGGKRMDVESYLNELDDSINPGESGKEELILDASCRITGQCSPEDRIAF